MVAAAGRRRPSTFALGGATGKGHVRRRRHGDVIRGVRAGIVKLRLAAVFDAQHGGFATGWSPVSWGAIDELFVNLTMPPAGAGVIARRRRGDKSPDSCHGREGTLSGGDLALQPGAFGISRLR